MSTYNRVVAADSSASLAPTVRARLATEMADPTSDVGASLSGTTARTFFTINVFDYLDGDPIPTATTGDLGAVLNRALLAAQVMADADTNGVYLVGIPAGSFRSATQVGFTQARSMVRVGIRGAGKLETRILTVGGISFFVPINTLQTSGSLSQYAMEDCVFSDFTSDMTGVTAPDPTGSSYKHFKGAGWRNCRFERIYAHGSPATGIGTDYIVDCSFNSVTVRDSGRGGEEPLFPWYNGGRSGFGIAVGWSEAESATFIDCHAADNLRSGFLFEYQQGTSTTFRQRMTLIGCSATGNHTGVSAAGASGVYVFASKVNNNDQAGVYIGPNEGSTLHGGNDVAIVNSEIAGNNWGVLGTGIATMDFGATENAPVDSFSGVKISGSDVHHNISHGVWGRKLVFDGLMIEGTTFDSNGGSGVRLEQERGNVEGVRIERNVFRGQLRHLDVLVPMSAPTVEGNKFTGGDVGIAYHAALTTTDPVQGGNVFTGVTTPVEIAAPTLADPNTDRIATAPAYTHSEYFGDVGATFPSAGWLSADIHGVEATWTIVEVTGIQVSGSSGQDAIAYRDMGSSGVYADIWLRQATSTQSPARMVVLGYDGPAVDPHETGEVRHFVGAGVYNTLSAFYGLFRYRTSSTVDPTVLWESTVPIEEGHVVAIRRVAGSTVTQMFIDGQLVHEEDVPLVVPTQYAGIYGIATDSQNRRIQAAHLAALT